MTCWLNTSPIFRKEPLHGEGDKQLHGRSRSIIRLQPCGHTAEKTVLVKNVCKRCYLGAPKKRAWVPLCQNQQLPGGCHSETKVRKSRGRFLAHVNVCRSPGWALSFFILAAYLRCPRERVACEAPFRLIWDIITGPQSVAPVAMIMWACAGVCEMTSQPGRATPLQHNSCHRGLESGPPPLQEPLSVTPPLFCCPHCLFFPMKGQPCHVTNNPPAACSEVSVCINLSLQAIQQCSESCSIKTPQLWPLNKHPGFFLRICAPNVATNLAGSLKWQLSVTNELKTTNYK